MKLYQLPALDGAPSLSPFCLKVSTYMRLADIAYESIVTLDATQGPKGKLPFIDDNGARIGDSYFIIDHLARTRGVALDASLTETERAIALAVSRMLDEHLYWAVVRSRWLDPVHGRRMLDVFLGALPAEQRAPIEPVVLDTLRGVMHAHGIGRHTDGEVVQCATEDVAAVATLLGDKPFVFGDRPTSIDACVYAFMANLVDVEMDTPLRRAALARPTLADHTKRMRARCYPELARA
ncbi:MAG TPA: glutathione S-transferase family protein [Kofleriaceae bacterium]